ncbi:MAG TPA: DUF6159 family protein [Candidatus Nanoarchaeia archaeon]|nr:DUF6159 family protein [Candidatus Nanoarchaeia archaeon]
MANIFSRSFQLAKESFRLLLLDKELLLFPMASGFFIVLILVTFIFPLFLVGAVFSRSTSGVAFYLWLFLFYLVSYFISIFFNVAIVSCVSMRLKGKDPLFMDGIRSSFKNIHRIFMWAAASATVGFVLNTLERKSEGWISRLIISFIGIAWTLATFFIIPVMIFENKGVIGSIKRSSEIFRNTLGESVIGQFGMGMFFFVLVLASVVLSFIIGFVIAPLSSLSGIIIGVIVFSTLLLLIIILSSVLNTIYMTALYTYATTKKVPAGFSREFIQNAYARKA